MNKNVDIKFSAHEFSYMYKIIIFLLLQSYRHFALNSFSDMHDND